MQGADTRGLGPWGIEHLVERLRPEDLNYVSLECALSEWGRISQVPITWLTVVTTGEAGRIDTGRGTIEFHQTWQGPGEIRARCVQVPGRPLLLAREDLAIEDLQRVGRNLNMLQPPNDDG